MSQDLFKFMWRIRSTGFIGMIRLIVCFDKIDFMTPLSSRTCLNQFFKRLFFFKRPTTTNNIGQILFIWTNVLRRTWARGRVRIFVSISRPIELISQHMEHEHAPWILMSIHRMMWHIPIRSIVHTFQFVFKRQIHD